MPSVSPKCPNCGAPVPEGESSCRFCQAVVLFSPDMQEVRLVGFPCPKCQSVGERGTSFCGKCGQPLAVKCSSCRHDMPLGVAICPHCRASRVVKALIADAEEEKEKVEAEAKEELARLQGQVDGHPQFKAVGERLREEAAGMRAQADGLKPTHSRSMLIAAASLLGAFLAPLVVFVLFAVLANVIREESVKGAIAGLGCICPGGLFLLLLIFGLIYAFQAHRMTKDMRNLREAAAARETAGAWKSFSNAEENRAIQSVFAWGEGQRSAVEQRKKERLAEIDARLEETVNALK